MTLFGIAVQAPLRTPISMLTTDHKDFFPEARRPRHTHSGVNIEMGGGRAIQHMEVEQHHLGLLGPADCLSRYFPLSMDSELSNITFDVEQVSKSGNPSVG